MTEDYRERAFARFAPFALASAEREFERIRRSSSRPIGLAEGVADRLPVIISSSWHGIIRPKLFNITLTYGEFKDISASLTTVQTKWRSEGGDAPLRYVLGMAERSDTALDRGDWQGANIPLLTLPPGPFRGDEIQVAVEGDHLKVRKITWKHYSAFRFSWRRLRVEVLQRHGGHDVANLTVVSDLERYFEGKRGT